MKDLTYYKFTNSKIEFYLKIVLYINERFPGYIYPM